MVSIFIKETLMQLNQNERLALFIDGANLFSTARALGIDIDYRELITFFRQRTRLVRALYFTAVSEDQEFSSIRPLLDWLEYNGFTLVTKPIKTFTDESGRRRYKGSIDVEITIDAMRLAPSLDHVVIFAGDGNLQALVAALQEQGNRVSVVSTLETDPPMVSDALRRQADEFIDLVELEPTISRDRRSSRSARTDRKRSAEQLDDDIDLNGT